MRNRNAKNILDMFPDRVQPEPNSGCWLWTGAIPNPKEPYGRVLVRRKFIRTHRLSFLLEHGQIPPHMWVLHKCDVMSCCNPTHLYLGDAVQNCRDRDSRGRHVALCGEKHANAKLTDDAIRTIRSFPSRRLPHGAREILASVFGVTPGHISDIRKSHWRHVP
jgi:hypothetical protein